MAARVPSSEMRASSARPRRYALVRRRVAGVAAGYSRSCSSAFMPHRQRAAHPLGDRVLQGEQILPGEIVVRAPQRAAVGGAQQLHAHPRAVRQRTARCR